MAEPYLTELQQIIDRYRARTDNAPDISCRHFFSGAAAYADGRIFMSLSPAGLALKLSEDDCAALFTAGGGPLRYFPKAPVKKGYAVLPPDMAEDADALLHWITRSLSFVGP